MADAPATRKKWYKIFGRANDGSASACVGVSQLNPGLHARLVTLSTTPLRSNPGLLSTMTSQAVRETNRSVTRADGSRVATSDSEFAEVPSAMRLM